MKYNPIYKGRNYQKEKFIEYYVSINCRMNVVRTIQNIKKYVFTVIQ